MVEKLLKANEVAQALGISKSFAYQLIRQGEIPSLRMGKAVRIRPSDLEAYVAKNIVGSKILPIFPRSASEVISPPPPY